MELAKGGELFDIIRLGKPLSEPNTRILSRQLLEGLKYLHDNGVCHGDLKPENILLDEMNNIKISDFGQAVRMENDVMEKTGGGTPQYMSPERRTGGPYNGISDDLFAAAIIIFMMLNGNHPFEWFKAELEDPKKIE